MSQGASWPAEHGRSEAGAVVILSAEDDAEDTIRPRLEVAGADLDDVYTLDAIHDVDEKGKPCKRAFSLERDLDRLDGLLSRIKSVRLKSVRLVVVDPISAYLGEADSHKNAEIRALLTPLSDFSCSAWRRRRGDISFQ